MTKVAEFAIEYTQFLDPSGKPVGALPEFARDAAALIPLYRAMVLTRRFDAKAISLQRTGRLGTYASSLGQEGVVIGLASAMRPEDVLLPSYRNPAPSSIAACAWRSCCCSGAGTSAAAISKGRARTSR